MGYRVGWYEAAFEPPAASRLAVAQLGSISYAIHKRRPCRSELDLTKFVRFDIPGEQGLDVFNGRRTGQMGRGRTR